MQETTDGRHGRSQKTRQSLLDAAEKLFAAGGYAGTGLHAIAASAGVNKALIRYHFGSKQGLYSAVLRAGIGAGRTLLEPLLASPAHAADRLDSYIDAMGELFEAHPHFAAIITFEWLSGGAHMEPEVLQDFMLFYHTDKAILEEGAREGQLRAVDPQAVHISLIGSLAFFHITRPVRAGDVGKHAADVAVRDYHDHVKHLFRRGLSNKHD